jgi:hypothetical protein
MSFDLTQQRLESSVRRVEVFIDQNISTWATEEILLPAQVDLANSINARAASALSIEKSGWMKADLVWDLRGENNEPLHFYLEFGTDPHVIEPKGKDNGGADVLHWKGPSGGFVIGGDSFAMKVNHPGSKKHKGLVQSIKDERMPNLKKRITDETTNFMELEKL